MANMADLSQKDWTKQLEEDNNKVVLDVRTQEEIDLGIIPNAIHIDIYKGQGFIDEVEKLDRTKNYYVYCRSGARSAQACSLMGQLGFKNTYNLIGGFNEWKGDVAFQD
jgi:rhodanese-related sulfurtransferase